MTEYCERESFEARCGPSEVIVMQHGVYGRMHLGGCVQQAYNNIGCSADVLPELDRRCSGKSECSFPVTSLQDVASPCPQDLMSYLEASYSCLPGKYNICNL